MVELAFLIPLLLIMALAIFDFARVFVSAIALEAATADAADYGSHYPWNWSIENTTVTEDEMERRACVAARELDDYVGDADGTSCTNPAFSYELIEPPGVTDCSTVPRTSAPCQVSVTLEYDFHVIVPLSIKFGDTLLGLPSTVALERSSVFAISDFEIDEPAPTP